MTVRIIIRRKVPEGTGTFLAPLLNELRTRAMSQPGYISGETYKRVDHPGQSLVISTWESEKDWENWITSKERADIQGKIDNLVKTETEYEIIRG